MAGNPPAPAPPAAEGPPSPARASLRSGRTLELPSPASASELSSMQALSIDGGPAAPVGGLTSLRYPIEESIKIAHASMEGSLRYTGVPVIGHKAQAISTWQRTAVSLMWLGQSGF